MPDPPHRRQRAVDELEAAGHVVLGQKRQAVVDRVLGLGDAHPDRGDIAPVVGQVVERALDLLHHERARVVAQRVDEGEHHDLAAIGREADAPAVLVGEGEVVGAQVRRHRRPVEWGLRDRRRRRRAAVAEHDEHDRRQQRDQDQHERALEFDPRQHGVDSSTPALARTALRLRQ
jgi:hypothetical protein